MHCEPQHKIGARIANSFLSTSSDFCEYSAAAMHNKGRAAMDIEDDAEFARVHSIRALNSVSHSFDDILGISHSKGYELVAEGQLVAVKVGAKTCVTGSSLIAFLKSLPEARITTGLSSKGDLTPDQLNKLAKTSPLGIAMREKRRGRPIGSKNTPKPIEQENRPTV
jgi:hypothetical protein